MERPGQRVTAKESPEDGSTNHSGLGVSRRRRALVKWTLLFAFAAVFFSLVSGTAGRALAPINPRRDFVRIDSCCVLPTTTPLSGAIRRPDGFAVVARSERRSRRRRDRNSPTASLATHKPYGYSNPADLDNPFVSRGIPGDAVVRLGRLGSAIPGRVLVVLLLRIHAQIDSIHAFRTCRHDVVKCLSAMGLRKKPDR
jgi:hypothetical protein